MGAAVPLGAVGARKSQVKVYSRRSHGVSYP
jgi:hypothetical protein